MADPAVAGFFGKLPSAGDFVQRRLPADFVDAWDQAFEQAVARTRQDLGDRWPALWRSAPAWRFVMAPGACGASACAGVTAPANDRVGRCFPMVVALDLGTEPAACAQALLDGGYWFDAAERAVLDGQATAEGVEAFDARVAALSAVLDMSWDDPAEQLVEVDWRGADLWRLPLPTHAASFLGDYWRRLIERPGAWCLWWTHGGGRVPPSVLASRGLPPAAAHAAFLDGDEARSAWRSLGCFEPLPTAVEHAAAPATAPAWPVDSDTTVTPAMTSVPASAPAAVPASAMAEPSPPAVATDPVPAVPDAAASAPAMLTLHRADCALTVVAADSGADPQQRGAAAVLGVAADLDATELASGMQVLRAHVMALNPVLHRSREDLIDPVAEDCAVIAARISGSQAALLRIGTAAAWHWRQGRLQPFFARSDASPLAADNDDTFGDLLYSPVSLVAPGLGATAQPTCSEVACAVQPGDRLLLLATSQLVRIAPDTLSRALALPSCGQACTQLASVAGLGPEPARWPLAIMEIDA